MDIIQEHCETILNYYVLKDFPIKLSPTLFVQLSRTCLTVVCPAQDPASVNVWELATTALQCLSHRSI